QRSNIVNHALTGPRWAANGYTGTPQLRTASGAPITATAGQGNGTWTYAPMPGSPSTLVIKPAEGVTPAQAVEHMFTNPNQYAFDCAAGVRVLNLRAELDTLRQMHGNEEGTRRFNERHAPTPQNPTGLFVYTHWDSADVRSVPAQNGQPASTTFGFDGGLWQAGANGVDPRNGAAVQAGNWCYFRFGSPESWTPT